MAWLGVGKDPWTGMDGIDCMDGADEAPTIARISLPARSSGVAGLPAEPLSRVSSVALRKGGTEGVPA